MAYVFFTAAIVSAVLGLSGGLGVTREGVARTLFLVFLVVFIVALVMNVVRRGRV